MKEFFGQYISNLQQQKSEFAQTALLCSGFHTSQKPFPLFISLKLNDPDYI
jgi:hypothetical protein